MAERTQLVGEQNCDHGVPNLRIDDLVVHGRADTEADQICVSQQMIEKIVAHRNKIKVQQVHQPIEL